MEATYSLKKKWRRGTELLTLYEALPPQSFSSLEPTPSDVPMACLFTTDAMATSPAQALVISFPLFTFSYFNMSCSQVRAERVGVTTQSKG